MSEPLASRNTPRRRRRWPLVALALLTLFLVAAVQSTDWLRAFGAQPAGERLTRMQRSPRYRDGGFDNAIPTVKSLPGSFWRTMRLQFSGDQQRVPPGAIPIVVGTRASYATPPASGLRATWLGHSTTLIEIDGVRVLTDPVWGDRASPSTWVGPRRFHPPPLALDALPPIDAVIISHDHYDHLDLNAVRRLAIRFPDARWFTPLGVGERVRRAGARLVEEMAWWERRAAGTVSVVCTPAQHSSGRGVADRNRSLWSGWSAEATHGDRRAVYFAGDTAYCPAFAEIGMRIGPFDACLLPIGAYEPRWYMRYVHMTPEEAVRAYEDLCRGDAAASTLVPIHWGTFRIADDALDEPPRRLRAAWAAAGFPQPALALLAHGETRRWPRRGLTEGEDS